MDSPRNRNYYHPGDDCRRYRPQMATHRFRHNFRDALRLDGKPDGAELCQRHPPRRQPLGAIRDSVSPQHVCPRDNCPDCDNRAHLAFWYILYDKSCIGFTSTVS